MGEEEGKGFKVTDRRGMNEEEETPPAEDADMSDHDVSDHDVSDHDVSDHEEPAEPPPADDAEPGPDEHPLTFATFVISLGDSALVHLGAIPNPVTNERTRDMRAARQTIDIIGIIEEKTRGNLSEDEEKLMTNLLYALRMQWVQAQGG